MLRLLALPCAELHLIYQCMFGMPASKPTYFAAWHMPTFRAAQKRYESPIDPSLIRKLVGRNSDGSFRTSVGKEYPSALCRAIAAAFVDFVLALDAQTEAPTVHTQAIGFQELVKPFLIALEGSAEDFGADFVAGEKLPLLVLPNVECSLAFPLLLC